MHFLHDTLLALHITSGTAGLAIGAWVISLSRDRPLRDRRALLYHWVVAVVALTSVGLVALDWPAVWWLLPIAVLTYGLALAGHVAQARRFPGWRATYAHGLGGSYIALITALLVVALTVDGPLDGVAAALVWVFPTLGGTVLIRAWDRRLARAHGPQPNLREASNRQRLSWGRVRLPAVGTGLALAAVAWFSGLIPGWVGSLAFVVSMAVYTCVGAPPKRDPIRLVSPVSGRWRAVNSPADRVPSHGLHAYGQSFALDLVHEPADGSRPATGWWPPARRPDRFPGFGKDVRAPADGVVLRAHDGERDHWSRNSYPALIYLFVEAGVRELTGPGRVFGNHIVLKLGDGEYAAVAHLQRGSLTVRPGDRVAMGQRIGRCGNSGTSTEPHVHLQCMDHDNVLLADGRPFTFVDVATGADAGLPSRTAPFASV